MALDLEVLRASELLASCPTLREPVIEGVLRRGEILNLIGATKAEKSWMMLDLCLSIAIGEPWLETFPTTQGGVLLIDAELHRESLAHRVAIAAEARGLSPGDYDNLHTTTLRGIRDVSLESVTEWIELHGQGMRFIAIDPLYRLLGRDKSENDNTSVGADYQLIDSAAGSTDAGMGIVHHASKGNQAHKQTTDVGSGAGSFSRACDAHLVIRPHKQEGHIVLDGEVRSFSRLHPTVFRREFPVWRPTDLDPTDIKQAGRRGTPLRTVVSAVVAVLQQGPQTESKLSEITGHKPKLITDAINRLSTDGRITRSDVRQRNNQTYDGWMLAV